MAQGGRKSSIRAVSIRREEVARIVNPNFLIPKFGWKPRSNLVVEIRW